MVPQYDPLWLAVTILETLRAQFEFLPESDECGWYCATCTYRQTSYFDLVKLVFVLVIRCSGDTDVLFLQVKLFRLAYMMFKPNLHAI